MTETKTVTRETVEVQTKEETLYVCVNCEQAFEEDETVPVAVDVDDDGRYSSKERFCQQCAETLLGDGVGGCRTKSGLYLPLVAEEGMKERLVIVPLLALSISPLIAMFGPDIDWADPNDAYLAGLFVGVCYAIVASFCWAVFNGLVVL